MGLPGDELKKRPFEYAFSEEKVLGAWAKVGAVPATRADLKAKKVRHEAVEGDPMKTQLEQLEAGHTAAQAKLAVAGLNATVFNATLPAKTAARVAPPTTADAQLKALLDAGSVNASNLWHICGAAPINCGIAVAADVALIKKADDDKLMAWQKKVDDLVALMVQVTSIVGNHSIKSAAFSYGSLGVKELEPLVKFVFASRPARVKGECFSSLKGKDALVRFMKAAGSEWLDTLRSQQADKLIGDKPKPRLSPALLTLTNTATMQPPALLTNTMPAPTPAALPTVRMGGLLPLARL
jgi:hypothetical protein